MDLNKIILQIAKKEKVIKTKDILKHLESYTPQYISLRVNKLVKEGLLIKSGSTAKARYALPENAEFLEKVYQKSLIRKSLKEHEVLDEVNRSASFLEELNENIRSNFDYAFSEMLNNAIDHSKSNKIDIQVLTDSENLKFVVNDKGIGVFRNVMKSRNLVHEFEAMQDLLKGKTTTQPHAHSGEGIFFTSKVADVFSLESYGYLLRVDNKINDVFFERLKRSKKGTKVTFILSKKSVKHLKDIFSKYETDHENPDFDKTEIRVKVYTVGTIYVSRSQARRILTGLDKFKQIVFDFDNVPTVGQAFADEIFRVFQINHPWITLTPINMNEAVKYMVDRVDKPQLKLPL